MINGLFGVPQPGHSRVDLRRERNEPHHAPIDGRESESDRLMAFQHLVVEEDGECFVGQEDMVTSFFIPKLPDSWPPHMTLDEPVNAQDIGLKVPGRRIANVPFRH